MNASPVLLRGAAVLLAVAAFIDPALMRERHIDAVVSVMASDPVRAAGAAARVARELDEEFTIVAAPFPGAAATVLVGDAVPTAADLGPGPVFVLPHRVGPGIAAVHAPQRAPLAGSVPVAVRLRGEQGGTLRLLQDGVVVDAVNTSTAGEHTVSLQFAPREAGTARLRVEVAAPDGDVVAEDLLVQVERAAWRVLFHDGRPSWLSTFVRRTVEQDPRFDTTARVLTSRDIATDFGQAGFALRDAARLGGFAAVVIGAPETLTTAEVQALQAFMRERGGAVLLLLDRNVPGAHQLLSGVTQWSQSEQPADLTGVLETVDERPALRVAERAYPATLPAGAQALVRDARGEAVIWRTSVGSGQLIVSGALDAWRHRAIEDTRFDDFWPALLAQAAAAAPPALDVTGGGVAAPGEWVRVDVGIRPDTRDRAGERVTAVLRGRAGGSPRALEVHATSAADRWSAEFRAPADTGMYDVVISAGDVAAAVPLLVLQQPARAAGTDPALLAAWARLRGGALVPAVDAGHGAAELLPLLRAALSDRAAPQPWHPMRSAWWLLPFTALLAGEWWWRRRRGLA